jgi:hypothetical protein
MPRSQWYSCLSDAWDQFSGTINEQNEEELAEEVAGDRTEFDQHNQRTGAWEDLLQQKCARHRQTPAGAVCEDGKNQNFTPYDEVRVEYS